MLNLRTFINSTHINITWDPPSSPNGIVSYRVSTEERDLHSDCVTLIFFANDVNQTVVSIGYRVEPYSEYTINVTSMTRAGLGEAAIVVLQTPEEGMYSGTSIIRTPSRPHATVLNREVSLVRRWRMHKFLLGLIILYPSESPHIENALGAGA